MSSAEKRAEFLGDFAKFMDALGESDSPLPLMMMFAQGQGNFQELGQNRQLALDMLLKMAVGLGAHPTYARILGGAADVIGLKGLDVTIEEILKSADISRRTFYQFFANKEEVLEALFSLIGDIFHLTIRLQMKEETSVRDRLLNMSTAYIDFHKVGGYLACNLYGEAMNPNSALAPLLQKFLDRNQAVLSEVMTGAFGKEINPTLVRAYLLALIGLVLNFHITPDTEMEVVDKLKADVAELLELLLAGFRAE